MRFSWQDVKKQVRRRDGELTLTVHFLRPGELRGEIARLIAYHEQCCGQPRKQFAQDEANACVGDYRLANCLLAVLSTWYAWRQPAWTTQLQELSEATRSALAESAIQSPIHLRLALFDYVNTHYTGFLDEQTRSLALHVFATLYDLTVDQLTYLLALDTEDESLLTRITVQPPSVEAVVALYNQWVFEAVLCNSSEVRFVIDGEAFLATQHAENSMRVITGLGAVIKRLCYLARKIGVYYDIAYEEKLSSNHRNMLSLTLYGPQDMTGSPQQYGARLARLCRTLLGYGQVSAPQPVGKRQATVALNKALCEAEATVFVFQQACRFRLEAALLALLPASEQQEAHEATHVAESTGIYDSSIEQFFAEAFASLAQSQETAGWQLEREPEPLLFAAHETGASGIFLPDFALTRAKRRIYVEILGFWTPAYRERKLYKLQHLQGHADVILAIPQEARQFFASLAETFPLVEYRHQLSATDLLRVLHTRYDDFEERLAKLDRASVQTSVREARFLPERDCYALLHCYRRTELPRAVAQVLAPDLAYTPGLGMYVHTWLEHLHRSFVEWIEAQTCATLPLSAVIQVCQTHWPELAACAERTIEALLDMWPEVRVQRESIFEAQVLVAAYQQREITHEENKREAEETVYPASHSKKVARIRHPGSKKQHQYEMNQQHLWE